MNPDLAIEFGREALLECLTLAAPVLIVAVVSAIAIGILQSTTQVNDQSVSFVPKIVFVAITLMFCLPWLSSHFLDYSRELFQNPSFRTAAPHQLYGSSQISTDAYLDSK